MLAIAGYQINEKIYESSNSIIYRGYREADKHPVIFKMLNQSHPSPEKIVWFKREYEVTQSLNLAGVVDVYGLESEQHQWVMVLEDFGGHSLALLGLAGQLTLAEFLPLAIQIVDILGQVHQKHIMHKDINPANIILNQSTGMVKLIDFGISTALSRENSTFRNPNVLDGTLPYISPEQTGRMNRAIDYRTDFYSLGVTFYELLTGQLPFSTTDPMEMVHAHIARQPTPPHQLKSGIPDMVSDIIMKLLSKNAEERYQSAVGLKTDLEECWRQWQTTGQIKPFVPGQYDVSDRFQIPQKLYGRQQEINDLLAAFERISTANLVPKLDVKRGNEIGVPPHQPGQVEMALVVGYAGIGKSALVQEVYKPITRRRGYFIAGKFDQFQKDIPYSALAQAFCALIQQLLTESEPQIATWREKLLAALGPNGQVMVDIIPELELIIGPQPDALELAPTEAQNRFNLLFQNFIKVFTQPEHPLVLFLDDLQWADRASLRLISLLMTAVGSRYLFIIGAYRDNEVNEAHPLMLTLDEIQQAEGRVNFINLTPLSLPNINQFVADTLHCPLETANPLAKLILTKTNGNPFFIAEFLKSLYAEELIKFDFEHSRWQWDLPQIQAHDITDNVVELMADKTQKLAPETQQVLQLAACVGNQFDLDTLAVVYQKSLRQTATDLWTALAEGLVLPLGEGYKVVGFEVQGLTGDITATYKFAHDRVQQAVYSLISEANKQAIHQQVGQLLLKDIPPDKREERIFDIVNQLNQGRGLVTTQAERDELAELNLLAGRKAKSSAAYQPALNYLQVGIELLGQAANSWKRHYELTLSLYVEATEVAYLNGNFEDMEQLAEAALPQTKTILDKVKIYESRIQAYIAQNKMLEAIEIARHVLKLLGVSLPQKPNKLHIILGLLQTKITVGKKGIKTLRELPEMTAPHKLAAMRIMKSTTAAAYIAKPALFPLITFKMVNLSIKYGHSPLSAFAYVTYGLLLCGVVGDIDSGSQFGKFALELVDRFNARELKARIDLGYNYGIQHWTIPIKEALPPLLEGYQIGLETGDLEYAALCILIYCKYNLLFDRNLGSVEQEIAKYSAAMQKFKQERHFYTNEMYRQVVLNLIGQAKDSTRLIGEAYNEEEMIPLVLETNDKSALHLIHAFKSRLSYLFQAYPQALKNIIIAEKYLEGARGSITVPLFYFYDSLIRLALYDSNEESKKKHTLKKVAANQKKMKNWSDHAPINYLHKFYLVEAERARVLGKDGAAREYYDQAITLAQENEYLNEEALGYELAARFYLTKGPVHLAHHYLRQAHYAYSRWGAVAKVNDLEDRYPQALVQAELSHSKSTLATTMSTLTTTTGSSATTGKHATVLDLASVFKASQAISGEIVLNTLLSKMMKIVIENAGAQRGFFIVEKEGHLVIEAEGEVSQAGHEEVKVTALQSIPVSSPSAVLKPDGEDVKRGSVPVAIINYVARTGENVALNDATHEDMFSQDPYIRQTRPKSILCVPMVNQGKLTGILYLENNLTTGAFTPDRVEVLKLLSTQIAISIENAGLYTNLEQSEKKYRTLFEDSKDTIFITTPDGQITDFNSIGLSLFGYAREEAIKLNVQDLYANLDDRTKIQQEMASHGSIKDFEVKLRKKDGSVIDGLVTATVRRASDDAVIAYQGIIRDITEQKRAQSLLEEYSRTLEQEVEKRTQELQEKNEALTETLQRLRATQQELIQSEKMAALGQLIAGIAHEINTPLGAIGASISNISNALNDSIHQLPQLFQRLSPQQQQDFFALLDRSLRSQPALSSREERKFKHTLSRELETQGVDEADTVADTLVDMGIYEDVDAFMPLFQSEDVDFILQTVYNLSSQQKNSQNITTAVERASKVVFALKSYVYRDPSGGMVEANIIDGLDVVLTLYHNQMKHGVEVIKKYQDVPAIRCAPDQLKQVWTNLLHNALQAMKNQGQLEIAVFQQNGQVVTQITDSGSGIPDEIKDRIFEPFFTTKSAGEGSGLGLDIVRKIIDNHQGKIEVESRPGKTTFSVLLPVAQR